MNLKFQIFESVASFRKGANANGVRAELPENSIPSEIKNFMLSKKGIKSK